MILYVRGAIGKQAQRHNIYVRDWQLKS